MPGITRLGRVAVGTCLLSGILISVPARGVVLSFENASSDVQEFIIDSITNCVRGSTVALVHMCERHSGRKEDFPKPGVDSWSLGLTTCRLMHVLKGNPLSGEYPFAYLYQPDATVLAVPPLWWVSGASGTGFSEGDVNPTVRVGKDVWRYLPPYRPENAGFNLFVQLKLLSPETLLDVRRIDPLPKVSADQLMRDLDVGGVFSNRVFRMNAGCSFLVDVPLPEALWRSHFNSREAYEKWRSRLLERKSFGVMEDIVRLGPDEASEITYLAYAVDGRSAEYEKACSGMPDILHPVANVRSELGRRLEHALIAGFMLPSTHGSKK